MEKQIGTPPEELQSKGVPLEIIEDIHGYNFTYWKCVKKGRIEGIKYLFNNGKEGHALMLYHNNEDHTKECFLFDQFGDYDNSYGKHKRKMLELLPLSEVQRLVNERKIEKYYNRLYKKGLNLYKPPPPPDEYVTFKIGKGLRLDFDRAKIDAGGFSFKLKDCVTVDEYERLINAPIDTERTVTVNKTRVIRGVHAYIYGNDPLSINRGQLRELLS